MNAHTCMILGVRILPIHEEADQCGPVGTPPSLYSPSVLVSCVGLAYVDDICIHQKILCSRVLLSAVFLILSLVYYDYKWSCCMLSTHALRLYGIYFSLMVSIVNSNPLNLLRSL